MSIEERIESALMDLEGLIIDQVPVEEALSLAAEPYNLKVAVLRARAAPSGEMEDYVSRVRGSATHAQSKSLIGKAVEQFVEHGTEWHLRAPEIQRRLNAAVGEALGREPTNYELTLASESRVAAIQRRQQRNFEATLRAIRDSDSGRDAED